MRRVWSRLVAILRSEQSGQALVELLVAMGIAAVMLPALATAMIASREGRAQQSQRMQATTLLREANEATRSVREKGWSQFATNGTYHPTISGSAWSFTAGTQTINGFTRQVVVADVQRNASGAIVASGGTVDSSTKKVTTTVSWATPSAGSVSSVTYYQRYLNNLAWNQTTQAEFTAGTKTNVTVTNNSGGEVELSSAGGGGTIWNNPTILGAYDSSGTTDAFDVFAVDAADRAYIAVGSILRIINIATPSSPTLLGSYTAGGTINGIYVSGNYAFLATTNNTGEFVSVNVSNPASPTATVLDLTGSNDGTGVFASGNTAYITRAVSTTSGQNEFYTINVTTPASPAVLGSLNMSANANSVYVGTNGANTYAYLATSIGTAELTIVNVTTPASPTQTGVYNTTGTAIANDVFAVGTTVYLAKAVDTGGAEFFIVNAATPATPSLVGSYEAGANINGVHINGTLAFLATATANNQFTVLSISTPAAPVITGSYNLGSTTNEIYFAGDHAFLASTSNTAELTIMQGEAGASGYQASGTFESSNFDAGAGASYAYNYITFTITEPASTNIRFQIATNNDGATWNYVGPDGTASTFYDTPQTIRLNTTGRYLRYKATFSGPGTSTPVLSDISINYSP